MSKPSKLIIDCDTKDKTRWVIAARLAGGSGKLADWVNATLNAAAAQVDIPAPTWMRFSDRTNAALVAAGITKRHELVDHMEQATLNTIPNIGPQQLIEINEWHDSINNK